MKKHLLEVITNSNLVKLANKLEKEEEILIEYNKKLFYIQYSCEGGFDVNKLNLEAFEDGEVDLDYIEDGGVFETESTLEAIILGLNL